MDITSQNLPHPLLPHLLLLILPFKLDTIHLVLDKSPGHLAWFLLIPRPPYLVSPHRPAAPLVSRMFLPQLHNAHLHKILSEHPFPLVIERSIERERGGEGRGEERGEGRRGERGGEGRGEERGGKERERGG